MTRRFLTVVWFSHFPVEWLEDVPPAIAALPKRHPSPWQSALLGELADRSELRLHIVILRPDFEKDLFFERRGVGFHLLRTSDRLRARTGFWFDTWRLRSVMRRIGPDVLHAWGTEEGAAIVATRFATPHVITVQGLMGWLATISPPTASERIAARKEALAFARARLVVAQSAFVAKIVREMAPHAEIREIEVAPEILFHEVARRPEPLRLLAAGATGYRKGLDVLIQAFSLLPPALDVRCVIAGLPDNAERRAMETRFGPEIWERFEFKPHLTRVEMADELARATLAVCPTRADTGPMVVREAIVAGVPVIGSDVGGVPDHIVPGRNGLLFPVGDAVACSEAIRAALHHPWFGRGRVDEAVLAAKRSELRPERAGQAYVDAYFAAADRRPRQPRR